VIKMSWENIIKFERDPYFYGESYMEQVEEIGEDIKKVIEYLESIRISMPSKNSVKIQTAIKMLEDIYTGT
tara:strand:+ start:9837 stop:10049 length:213 start_codon:yes stop_codon:yes gene_type:complete